jgi:hypothetical protein
MAQEKFSPAVGADDSGARTTALAEERQTPLRPYYESKAENPRTPAEIIALLAAR